MVKNLTKILIILCLLLLWPSDLQAAPWASPVWKAYDFTDSIIDVTAYGAIADDNLSDRDAINAALDEAAQSTSPKTVYFPPGVYDIDDQIREDSIDQITLFGFGNATIKRMAGFADDWAIRSNYATNIQIIGLRFEGETTSTTGTDSGDNMFWFPSGKKVTFDRCYFGNIGGVAINFSEHSGDSGDATVDAHDLTVTNSYFYNVFQTSTTNSSATNGGGAFNTKYIGNTFENLKDAVNFKSRQAKSGTAIFIGNVIKGSKLSGVTFHSVSNVICANNIISDIDNRAIHVTTNNTSSITTIFDWGMILISDNIIDGAVRGISVVAADYNAGGAYNVLGISILGNLLKDISHATDYAIVVTDGGDAVMDNIFVKLNMMENITSGNYVSIPTVTNSDVTGNLES